METWKDTSQLAGWQQLVTQKSEHIQADKSTESLLIQYYRDNLMQGLKQQTTDKPTLLMIFKPPFRNELAAL